MKVWRCGLDFVWWREVLNGGKRRSGLDGCWVVGFISQLSKGTVACLWMAYWIGGTVCRWQKLW